MLPIFVDVQVREMPRKEGPPFPLTHLSLHEPGDSILVFLWFNSYTCICLHGWLVVFSFFSCDGSFVGLGVVLLGISTDLVRTSLLQLFMNVLDPPWSVLLPYVVHHGPVAGEHHEVF